MYECSLLPDAESEGTMHKITSVTLLMYSAIAARWDREILFYITVLSASFAIPLRGKSPFP